MTESVKLIRLVTNEVIIAKVVETSENSLTLHEPFALIPTKDDKMQFLPWAPLTEEDTTVELNKFHVVYTSTPNQGIVDHYNDSFSNIIKPPSAGKIIT